MNTADYYHKYIRPNPPSKLYSGTRSHCFQLDGHSAITTLIEHFRYGQLHRLDGPAVHSIDGFAEYWVGGKAYTYDDYFNNKEVTEHKESHE